MCSCQMPENQIQIGVFLDKSRTIIKKVGWGDFSLYDQNEEFGPDLLDTDDALKPCFLGLILAIAFLTYAILGKRITNRRDNLIVPIKI